MGLTETGTWSVRGYQISNLKICEAKIGRIARFGARAIPGIIKDCITGTKPICTRLIC